MKKVYIPMYIYENDENMPSAKAGRTTIASDDVEIWDDSSYAIPAWNDGGVILSVSNDDIVEDYEVTENIARIETFESIMKRLVSLSTRQLSVIFGVNTLYKVITYLTYEEIIKKLNEFDTNPKVGEIWQKPITGVRVLIVGVKENSISVIIVGDDNDNTVEELSRENFFEIYVNSGEKSKYYNALINEIK